MNLMNEMYKKEVKLQNTLFYCWVAISIIITLIVISAFYDPTGKPLFYVVFIITTCSIVIGIAISFIPWVVTCLIIEWYYYEKKKRIEALKEFICLDINYLPAKEQKFYNESLKRLTNDLYILQCNRYNTPKDTSVTSDQENVITRLYKQIDDVRLESRKAIATINNKDVDNSKEFTFMNQKIDDMKYNVTKIGQRVSAMIDSVNEKFHDVETKQVDVGKEIKSLEEKCLNIDLRSGNHYRGITDLQDGINKAWQEIEKLKILLEEKRDKNIDW